MSDLADIEAIIQRALAISNGYSMEPWTPEQTEAYLRSEIMEVLRRRVEAGIMGQSYADALVESMEFEWVNTEEHPYTLNIRMKPPPESVEITIVKRPIDGNEQAGAGPGQVPPGPGGEG